MIDEKVFRDTWALLCERFRQEPSQPLMLAYYRTLSAELTTEQFRKAAHQIFVHREFFPRPADFLEHGRTDPKADAIEQWEVVQGVMKGFPEYDRLTPESRRVIKMLGGEKKLRDTPVDAVQYVRRDFMELYGDVAEIARREAGQRIEASPEGNRLTGEIMEAARKGLPPLQNQKDSAA